MSGQGELEPRPRRVDQTVRDCRERVFASAFPLEDGLQTAQDIAVPGLTERQAAPRCAQTRAERGRVRTVAGDSTSRCASCSPRDRASAD